MLDDEDFKKGTLDQNPPDPAPNSNWIKKYCTATSVDYFIEYFPFILLIIALVLVLIERGFIRYMLSFIVEN